MRETSLVGGHSRHAATPSRIPCFIAAAGNIDDNRGEMLGVAGCIVK